MWKFCDCSNKIWYLSTSANKSVVTLITIIRTVDCSESKVGVVSSSSWSRLLYDKSFLWIFCIIKFFWNNNSKFINFFINTSRIFLPFKEWYVSSITKWCYTTSSKSIVYFTTIDSITISMNEPTIICAIILYWWSNITWILFRNSTYNSKICSTINSNCCTILSIC